MLESNISRMFVQSKTMAIDTDSLFLVVDIAQDFVSDILESVDLFPGFLHFGREDFLERFQSFELLQDKEASVFFIH